MPEWKGGPDKGGGPPGGPEIEFTGGSCGPLLVLLLVKLEPPWTSIMSAFDVFHRSCSTPSRMRMSMARALDGWAISLKKVIVLAKRSLSVCSSMNLLSVGSRNAAARVRRLPHCLQSYRLV